MGVPINCIKNGYQAIYNSDLKCRFTTMGNAPAPDYCCKGYSNYIIGISDRGKIKKSPDCVKTTNNNKIECKVPGNDSYHCDLSSCK